MEFENLRDAINRSIVLSKSGQHEHAFRLLDDAIASAIAMDDSAWVLTLSHHAAVLSRFAGDLVLTKNYYETSLRARPENPRALYGLADAAREQGQAEVANDYATRCYRAVLRSEDELIKRRVLDLLLKGWLDLAT